MELIETLATQKHEFEYRDKSTGAAFWDQNNFDAGDRNEKLFSWNFIY